MEETKFYTVRELMQMGGINKRESKDELKHITKDDKDQLAFAEATSSKMLVNLVEIPSSKKDEEIRAVKGQISIFSLGKKKNGKRNR